MSGFSGGSFSFSRSSGRGGGFLGHSHSHSGHRAHYGHGGHHRQSRYAPRSHSRGCLGIFLVGAALAAGSVVGLVSLIA